jgi:ribonuclease HII
LVEYHGTKGAVLGQALAQLLPAQIKACSDSDTILCFIDKHGGRNSYAAMLQDALCEGTVLAHEERMARSVYTVNGLGREVRLTVQPRADAEHFCVALASMVSKYVRELLMLEFNQYWLSKVEGLKPTAGYPGDAVRFFDAIRPAIKRLAIAPESIWRCR